MPKNGCVVGVKCVQSLGVGCGDNKYSTVFEHRTHNKTTLARRYQWVIPT